MVLSDSDDIGHETHVVSLPCAGLAVKTSLRW